MNDAGMRQCKCGHADFEHAGKTHNGNECLGNDLACACEKFAPVTAPVTRVEYLVRDARGDNHPAESLTHAQRRMLTRNATFAHLAPHVIIERTITERVLAPQEEG